jgi:ubiquinone/menaquinone biosynthesis C-methylase UbiE
MMGATDRAGYVLGESERAARRLDIQDAHFAEVSEELLDELELKAADRVVELGCGPGGLSRRILRRLGADGVVVGVDSSDQLLAQARRRAEGFGAARFEPVHADISGLGSWLEGADVVVGRAVLHHVPLAERLIGRLRAALPRGTRVGFLEPDFRTRLASLSYLIDRGQLELEPLLTWTVTINRLYQMNQLSPDVGATLARSLDAAGFDSIRAEWTAFPSDAFVIENMLMFYDEVRDRLQSLGILSLAEIERQQRLLRSLSVGHHPAAWGMHRVVCRA